MSHLLSNSDYSFRLCLSTVLWEPNINNKKRRAASLLPIHAHIILMVCDGGAVQAHHRLSCVATYTKEPKELPPYVSWVLDERRNPQGVIERWPLCMHRLP